MTRIATVLPSELVYYRQTPVFTVGTVPKPLLSAHSVKADVWGLLRVSRGRVRYCLDGAAAETLLIEPGGTAVIEPEVPHHVELLDEDSAFLVEFHRGAMRKRVSLASDLVGIASRPHSSMSSPQGIPRCMTRDPHPKAPGSLAGITESMIRSLVDTFYARVRHDPLLGPVFDRAIEDWGAHLDKLCAFWSSVTLMTGRYKGTPMKAHAELPEMTPAHFERWLALFQDTTKRICPPRAAEIFIDRANRIADSLQLGIALYRGEGVVLPALSKARPVKEA